MTIVNGYCTLAEFKSQPNITTTDATDDAFIETVIEKVSRMIDAETNKWFYADTLTRLYDLPVDRQLDLDAPLLTLTTLTNGDASVISASSYILLDANISPYYAVRLKQNSGVYWIGSSGNTEQVISVAGTWGWISQGATDSRSVKIKNNVKQLCLEWAVAQYRRRYGSNVDGMSEVTPSGVIIPSKDLSSSAWSILTGLKSITG